MHMVQTYTQNKIKKVRPLRSDDVMRLHPRRMDESTHELRGQLAVWKMGLL